MKRNLDLEALVLAESEALCLQAYKVRPWRFTHLARERAAKGAVEYGDLAFHGRGADGNLVEALVEPVDVANYMCWWLQCKWPRLTGEERCLHQQRAVGIIAGAMALYAQLEELRREDRLS